MKKFTSILITLCMLLSLLPLAVHAAATPTNLLTPEKLVHKFASDNWTFNADGTLTAANLNFHDAAYLTDIVVNKGDHVYIEATAKTTGNTAWGILFTESGKDNPFGNWFCVNIDYDWQMSRAFFINSVATHGLPYEPQLTMKEARDGQYHTLGVELLPDGTMKLYLDGEMHTYLDKASFSSATLGIMTCRANVEFKSFTIQEGAPTHTTVRNTTPRQLSYKSTTNLLDANVLKYQTSDNRFTIADGKMTANRAGGDRAIMSDIFVAPGDHVYIEATAKITDGNAWGIMLGEASAERPFDRWICINASVDVYKSRIFAPNAHCNVATPLEHFYFSESMARGNYVTLGLEITPDGTFYMTCNGVTYEEKQATVWEGAWVGLMTWEANIECTSATFNVVCDHETTKLEGKQDATESAPGYTGDTVCADCGTVLEKGSSIPQLKPTNPPKTGDTVVIAAAVSAVALAAAVLLIKRKERI